MIPVFVTRPAHQAAGLIEAVARRGFAPVGAPCLTLSLQTGPPLDLAGIGGFAVTSINGVTALAARTNERALPVYAVGEATAAEARRHGFQHLAVAAGDGAALADLIRETVPPRSKAILHAAGAETAFDLAASLEPHGIPVECRALYAMTPAGTLPRSPGGARHEPPVLRAADVAAHRVGVRRTDRASRAGARLHDGPVHVGRHRPIGRRVSLPPHRRVRTRNPGLAARSA